ncbi:MAG: M20/M25/M40 family metallo-hydrolase, partial [Defluviitaleaceae bacterium]|nr:M20/M25/M40 family metallo-hydrolase [Defluviitaleaceae bacterium]
GIFTVSCAGGVGVMAHIPITRKKLEENLKVYEVSISGLSGGHSGMDIHKNLANSNRLMARLLLDIGIKHLISINGGMKSNAIPREAVAKFAATGDININNITEIFKNEHIENEPNLQITYKETTASEFIENTESIINALITLPYGVLRQTEQGVISSTNIGVVETLENEILITNAVRSSILSLREFMKSQIEIITKMAGGYIKASDGYPAWEYKKDNPLRDKALEVYKNFTGKEATIELSHGGLECGIFASKMEGVNFIAMGPNNYNLHTPDEQLNINSADRVFNFLVKFLEELK